MKKFLEEVTMVNLSNKMDIYFAEFLQLILSG